MHTKTLWRLCVAKLFANTLNSTALAERVTYCPWITLQSPVIDIYHSLWEVLRYLMVWLSRTDFCAAFQRLLSGAFANPLFLASLQASTPSSHQAATTLPQHRAQSGD